MTRRRKYLVLLGIWVGFTFVLTSIPNPNLAIDIPFSDKVAHFGFYAVTGFLCAMWRRHCSASAAMAILAGAGLAALVGGIDEIHQNWIPGRTMDLFDWLADAAGGGVGAMISAVLPSLFPFLLTE